MQNDDRKLRQQAWSSYWEQGLLHSCVGSYSRNYGGAIGAFWRERFSRLGPGSRVLDLATGNGALPKLCWEQVGRAGQVTIDAVDLAQVSPPWYLPTTHSKVSFHSQVPLEQLPFEDAAFDLVTSQYGIEYASWPGALVEAARVCKSAGTLAFVMHHEDSLLVQMGRAELAHQDLLLANDGLLSSAEDVLPWVACIRAGDASSRTNPEALTARQRYNQSVELVSRDAARSPAPDLLIQVRHQVHQLLNGKGAGDSEQGIGLLRQLRSALEDARLRTAEMISCALTPARLVELQSCLYALANGREVTLSRIEQEEGLLGLGIEVRSSGST